jgi:hypothetical protein
MEVLGMQEIPHKGIPVTTAWQLTENQNQW